MRYLLILLIGLAGCSTGLCGQIVLDSLSYTVGKSCSDEFVHTVFVEFDATEADSIEFIYLSIGGADEKVETKFILLEPKIDNDRVFISKHEGTPFRYRFLIKALLLPAKIKELGHIRLYVSDTSYKYSNTLLKEVRPKNKK
ncbi:hypothetical protein QWY85_00310 [Neolewinella lacunae]|uniref:Uncharacterized protein n=1 Tax=Neolewinella lacunae TaxID=1517758 RepID=A0A923TDZ4_9BACT|nr:hypothetical protein [Neolewinella lacunae]MBC6995367.1 hypothetical protein [Neolewinella lacunae]MDN3633079.1 hypothetical protein [Neolewinella lacunae]